MASILTSTGITFGDGTNITTNLIPSGTLMLFQQTTAPTGWTKQTTHNDKALRVVSGTASSGGTTAFSSVMTSRTPTGTISGSNSGGSVSDTTLTEAQIPSHIHSYTTAYYLGSGTANFDGTALTGNSAQGGYNTFNAIPSQNTAATGGSSAHGHGFTNPTWSGSFSGTAIDFSVQYVDLIIASKT